MSLSTLTNEQRDLVALAHNAQSPVNQLPIELLIEIFAAGFPHMREGDPWPARFYHLRDITSVCSFWREIAIGTPTLWTMIRFHQFQRLPEAGFQLWYDRIETFLERSCEASLDISLMFLILDEASAEYITRVMDVLSPHMHRARTFNIFAHRSNEYDIRRVFPLKGDLGRLQRVECGFGARREPDAESGRHEPVELFARPAELKGTVPLKSLSLMSYPFGLTNVPTERLAEVNLNGRWGVEPVAIFIMRSPSLKVLGLQILAGGYYPFMSPLAKPSRPTFPTGRFEPSLPSYAPPCSSVRHLTLNRFQDDATLASLARTSLSSPSPSFAAFNALESLTLSQMKLHDSVIRPFLVANPGIRILTIARCFDQVLVPLVLLGADPADVRAFLSPSATAAGLYRGNMGARVQTEATVIGGERPSEKEDSLPFELLHSSSSHILPSLSSLRLVECQAAASSLPVPSFGSASFGALLERVMEHPDRSGLQVRTDRRSFMRSQRTITEVQERFKDRFSVVGA